MPKSIGLIGEPAVGKTTVMRKLIESLQFKPHKLDRAKWMECEEQKLILIGSYFGHIFDGSDRLSMSCYSDLETMLQYFQQSDALCSYTVLWEGDRLARKRWLDALTLCGYELKLFHLRADLETVNERRRRRGTKQNASWVSGRRNLCRRLADEHNAQVFSVVDEKSVAELVGVLKNKIGVELK